MTNIGESRAYLRGLGDNPSYNFDIAIAALHLAALKRTKADLTSAASHLEGLAATLDKIVETARPEDAASAARALSEIVAQKNRYRGDDQTYDDLQNADLLSVIKRRKGLPVALGILYLHVARRQGWTAYGLNFPGHFLVALEFGGERTILDPFHNGVIRTPPELRELLKMVAGQDAELEQDMFSKVPDRGVLLRLQSNIHLRQIQKGSLAEARETVNSMLLIAPEQAALWHELGILQTKLGNLGAALQSFKSAAERETSPWRRQEIDDLLQQLRQQLN